jgi:hypothetical protein
MPVAFLHQLLQAATRVHHMRAAAIPLDQIGDEVSATLRDGCLRAPSHAATALIRSG